MRLASFRSRGSRIATLAVAAALGMLAAAAHADFELKVPSGRTILVKDDGTWRYLDAAEGAASAPKDDGPQAELRIVARQDASDGCVFSLTLANLLPYAIRHIVPEFAAVRANGVEVTTQTVGFLGLKPGDQLQRELRFPGIACADIAKLQVQRGDRCEMGELNRFSDVTGQCLARVRLVRSDLVKFEK